MKSIFLALFLSLIYFSFAQQTAHLSEINYKSKFLNQKRPIYIYTPAEYVERDLVSFDVIYVFDAQSREIFDLVHSNLSFIFPNKRFIVVGISSPAYEKSEYYRVSDFLPKPINVPLEKYQTDKPNAENFWLFFKDEVMPYIGKNYRTTDVNYLIGHSLSASFVLDKAIHYPDLCKGYLCISPNFAYDNQRLANDFMNNDFSKAKTDKFIYLSQCNEPETFPTAWADAYWKVESFIDTTADFKKFEVQTKLFPEYNHWQGFMPALQDGLTALSYFIERTPYALDSIPNEITITLTVPNKTDEVYIVGNQESLGNWEASAVKMDKISDFERTIQLKVNYPIEFKFTKGSWETEGFTDQTTNDAENIVIYRPKSNKLKLKILAWAE
jgi:predicted alpha/beta superfamily hydrolase